MRPEKHRYRRGLTLIEILTVVVIIGIAGAIIVPQIGSRDDLRTAAAARLVMADLIYAQNLSITQQKNQYVMFDLTSASHNYSVVNSAGMTVVTHPVTRTPYTVTFGTGGTAGLENAQLVSASFTGQGGATSSTLGFDELGTPLVYASGSTQVMTTGSILVQTGDQKLKIDIEPFTGLISVNAAN
jgi:prepilin-type N-terminal cleavage/methylation domain-containing protein